MGDLHRDYTAAGFAGRLGWGVRPALLLVDPVLAHTAGGGGDDGAGGGGPRDGRARGVDRGPPAPAPGELVVIAADEALTALKQFG